MSIPHIYLLTGVLSCSFAVMLLIGGYKRWPALPVSARLMLLGLVCWFARYGVRVSDRSSPPNTLARVTGEPWVLAVSMALMCVLGFAYAQNRKE